MDIKEIKEKIILNGVRNLKEFGYPNVDEKNILTDVVYSDFFKSMLEENKTSGNLTIDLAITELLTEITKQ
jgi:hypothetical protein